MTYNWFKFLDRHILIRGMPGSFLKVLLDQALFAPVMLFVTFLSTNLLMGHSLTHFLRKLDQVRSHLRE